MARRLATSETLVHRYNDEERRIQHHRRALERLEEQHRHTYNEVFRRLPDGWAVQLPGHNDTDRTISLVPPKEQS